jgi:hypothetical protein
MNIAKLFELAPLIGSLGVNQVTFHVSHPTLLEIQKKYQKEPGPTIVECGGIRYTFLPI